MMIADTILVATGNAHKIAELTELFASHGLHVTLRPLTEVAPDLVIEETGTTFEANAYIKAATAHAATGMPVLADDSGLEVTALDGAPGVYSARYAGPQANDADNRALLLQRMDGVDDRRAAFRCVLCYVDDRHVLFGEGRCSGRIGTTARGDGGFGYDPLFTHDGDERTFAELTSAEKHTRSHRGAAVVDLIRVIAKLEDDTHHDVHPPLRDALLRASIGAGTANDTILRAALHDVTDAHGARMMYEALLQCYLFGGFPAALDALTTFARHLSTTAIVFTPPPAEPFDIDLFKGRGETLCRTVYGSVYERMMTRLTDVTPDLRAWMVVEGYGKTLSREGLDVIDRELCIVAMLAATHRATQLYSHVRGAMLVGATDDDLQDVINVVTECCGRAEGDAIRAIMRDLAV
jgi:XTP/dITP diphosphohydrolase